MRELIYVGVFLASTIVGYFIIKNVPSLLHTPLMSGMNALSGVTLLGAMTSSTAAVIATQMSHQVVGQIFGALAIILAMINVAGGFAVTHRMLRMFNKKKRGK